MVVYPNLVGLLLLLRLILSSARHQRAATTKSKASNFPNLRWVLDLLLDLPLLEHLDLLDHHYQSSSTDLQKHPVLLSQPKALPTSHPNNTHNENNPNLPYPLSLPPSPRLHHHEAGRISWLGPRLSSRGRVMLRSTRMKLVGVDRGIEGKTQLRTNRSSRKNHCRQRPKVVFNRSLPG